MIYQPYPFKFCPHCHTFQEYNCFGHDNKTCDKLKCWCKACRSIGRRANYENNKEKVRKQTYQWSVNNRDARRVIETRYRKNHPEKERQKQGRARARRVGLIGTFSDSDWRSCLIYWYGVCAYCEHPPRLWDNPRVLHKDHFIPQSKGGNFTPDNIIPACQSCNCSRQERDPMEWMIWKFGKRKATQRINAINAYFASLK